MAFIKFKPIAEVINFKTVLNEEESKVELNKILESEEKVIIAFKAIRDVCIFTDKRIILVNKKGLKGFCKSIYSIKYSSISSYTMNIHSINTSIDLIFDSGYRLKMNFFKPIPLSDMYQT